MVKMEEIFRYNWHETNIAEFLHRHSLPVLCEETDIATFIRNYRDSYLADYDAVIRDGNIKGFSDETYRSLYAQKSSNAITFDKIIAAIKACQSSHYGDAENLVDEIMADSERDHLITSINGVERFNPTLFRIRAHINKPQDKICPKDLFHIPFDSRQLTSNERFSIAGQPCLYLSTYLNIAWKECGMPSSFYYSKYEYNYQKDESDPWRFLVLAKPQLFRNALCAREGTDSLDFICRYLRTLPIVMACSIICKSQGSPYKPEYVFPQLIMQWVHRHFETIKGVIYYPCAYDTSSRKYNGYNIAIPAVDPNEECYSRPLLERFVVSQPLYRSNEFSIEQKHSIESLYNEAACFNCKQLELADCTSELYDIAQSLLILSRKSDQIDSDILIAFVSCANKRISEFISKYHVADLVESCRNSETYQARYEGEISEFTKLFENFSTIKQLMDEYSRHIEHGYA